MYEIRFHGYTVENDIVHYGLGVDVHRARKPVVIEASGELVHGVAYRLDNGEPSLNPAENPTALCACLRFGLSRLEAQLLAGWELPETPHTLPLLCEETDAVVASWEDRRCAWRRESVRGPLCTSARDLTQRTVRGACEKCPVPDDASRCHNLVHVETQDTSDHEGFDRMLVLALCDAKQELDLRTLAGCGIGVALPRKCWRRRVEVASRLVIPEDVAERLVDEIDFLRLIFRERYGSDAVWPIGHARSVACFFTSPPSLLEFQSCLSSLVDLLDQLSVPRSEGTEAESSGRLAVLQAALERDRPELAVNVASLRRIVAVRRALVHSNTREKHLIDTCRELGIDYPPQAWQTAWRQLLAACWRSLHALRVGLQAPPVDVVESNSEKG